MISQELYRQIRRCKNDGLSQRAVAAKLSVWRGTVAKYWDGAHIPGVDDTARLAEPAGKAALKAAMLKYYEEYKDSQFAKQAINAKILWRDLHFEYPRSQSTYRRCWAEIKEERHIEAHLPLLFAIGQAAEMDWVEVKARYKGETVKLYIFCMVLMYGYTPFLKAYPNMKMQNFIDGHVSAFTAYHGIPHTIIYDNLPTGRKAGYGRKAIKTNEFAMLVAHYSFNCEFCMPYDPASKGGVENLADTASDIMTPVRNFSKIAEINDILYKECAAYIENTGAVGLRSRPVKEMTEEERGHLLPLPLKRYEVAEEHTVTVDNRQMFRFDNCLYSVPWQYAGKAAAVKAYPYKVEVYCRGHLIWECDRPMAMSGENRVYAEHYKFSLDKAPRARENAFPLKEGILPQALHEFRRLCKSGNKYTQLYELMVKMDEIGAEKLLKAVEAANAAGNPTYTKVMDILANADEGSSKPENAVYVVDGPDVDKRGPSGFDILLKTAGRLKE